MKGQWFADKRTLSDNMCISTKTFDRYFLHDKCMKSIEHRKSKTIYD